MLKYDEVVRRMIIKELEEEDFDPFRCSSFDARRQGTKKKIKGDLEEMDFEMSYAKVKDKDYHVSNDDEDDNPQTLPHYHSNEFHDDSSNKE
ncbi:hypothetical protein FNV43_RR24729 [Rhamnella rubrinervis]|uniref:Uncharacterized protein n=1 Tax=Rhamnella rubrinervis TaxID=2594499 RepID=A0A8K0DNC3_9ROSA|nr:hypothetical protein FNV43_RR24729 [Rhamnella rubrinervis]